MRAPSGVEESIGHDRRSTHRYGLCLPVRYRVDTRVAVYSGLGVTQDISSDGVYFTIDQKFVLGGAIQLLIEWPVLQYNAFRLQLHMIGKIVRMDQLGVAVKALRHTFIVGPFSLDHPIKLRPGRLVNARRGDH